MVVNPADGASRSHSSHWGVFSGRWADGKLVIDSHPGDSSPSPLLQNFPDAIHHKARVLHPMVRRSWLERGPGPNRARGRDDEFVQMTWPAVLDLLAAELARVRDAHGPGAIFGGSYGWSSAGRFHHAQSQVHRFLNCALGGYVRSVNSYSAGASAVILPHILGPFDAVCRRNVTWEQIKEHTKVVLAFGGMPLKNVMVASGGISRHIERDAMRDAHANGTRFVLVRPVARRPARRTPAPSGFPWCRARIPRLMLGLGAHAGPGWAARPGRSWTASAPVTTGSRTT